MAILYEEKLKEEIKAKTVSGKYILFGNDSYLKDLYLNKLISSVCEKDDVFNFCKFTNDCDLQEVYDAFMQLPMMSDKKCVLLSDFDYTHAGKSDLDKLNEILSTENEDTVFIMVFNAFEVDFKKDNKFKKLVSSAEKANGKAFLLNHRTANDLCKMLVAGAGKRKVKLEMNAARYLVETAGEDILILQNELNKLCFFLNNSGEITKDVIDKVCIKSVEASVYNITKDIFSLNADGALKTVDDLLFMRLDPIVILYTIAGTFTDMYRVYCGKGCGKNLNEIAEIFGYKNRAFVLEKAAGNLNRMDEKRFSLCFKALISADKGLKSGANPRVAIEQLIVRLIYIIARGEAIDKA